MGNFSLSWLDFKDAIKKHRVWLYLGILEVKQRYRRSVLGPWWISFSMLIFVLSMSLVFSRLFAQNLKDYIPFLTAGFLAWQFISSSVAESTDLFKNSGGYIKQVNLPYNLYVLKHLTRQVSVFLHNFVVYLLVALFFHVPINFNSLLVLPGILLLIVNLYWISLFIGLIGVRFRDMTPIITNTVQIAFFVTPVSWMPKLLSSNSMILKLNPLVYLIEIIRNPLLGNAPSLQAWSVTICMTVAGLTLSYFAFSALRHRIVFWVD